MVEAILTGSMLLSDCTRLLLSMQASTRAAEGGKEDHKTYNFLYNEPALCNTIHELKGRHMLQHIILQYSEHNSLSVKQIQHFSLTDIHKFCFVSIHIWKEKCCPMESGSKTTHNRRDGTVPTQTNLYALPQRTILYTITDHSPKHLIVFWVFNIFMQLSTKLFILMNSTTCNLGIFNFSNKIKD